MSKNTKATSGFAGLNQTRLNKAMSKVIGGSSKSLHQGYVEAMREDGIDVDDIKALTLPEFSVDETIKREVVIRANDTETLLSGLIIDHLKVPEAFLSEWHDAIDRQKSTEAQLVWADSPVPQYAPSEYKTIDIFYKAIVTNESITQSEKGVNVFSNYTLNQMAKSYRTNIREGFKSGDASLAKLIDATATGSFSDAKSMYRALYAVKITKIADLVAPYGETHFLELINLLNRLHSDYRIDAKLYMHSKTKEYLQKLIITSEFAFTYDIRKAVNTAIVDDASMYPIDYVRKDTDTETFYPVYAYGKVDVTFRANNGSNFNIVTDPYSIDGCVVVKQQAKVDIALQNDLSMVLGVIELPTAVLVDAEPVKVSDDTPKSSAPADDAPVATKAKKAPKAKAAKAKK